MHADSCRIHIDVIIKTSEDFFKKIYLSLYLKGLKRVTQGFTVRGSWRPNKNCNILTSPAPPDIAVCRTHSPGLLNRGPGSPASLGHALIPASSHQLVWSPNSLGSRGPLLLGSGFLYHILSLTHLISNSIGVPKGPFCRVVAFSTTSCL